MKQRIWKEWKQLNWCRFAIEAIFGVWFLWMMAVSQAFLFNRHTRIIGSMKELSNAVMQIEQTNDLIMLSLKCIIIVLSVLFLGGAVYLFASEFEAGTITRLFSQPLARKRLWREKLIALGALYLFAGLLLLSAEILSEICNQSQIIDSSNFSYQLVEQRIKKYQEFNPTLQRNYYDAISWIESDVDRGYVHRPYIFLAYTCRLNLMAVILPLLGCCFGGFILLTGAGILAALFVRKTHVAFFGALVWLIIGFNVLLFLTTWLLPWIEREEILLLIPFAGLTIVTWALARWKFMRLEI